MEWTARFHFVFFFKTKYVLNPILNLKRALKTTFLTKKAFENTGDEHGHGFDAGGGGLCLEVQQCFFIISNVFWKTLPTFTGFFSTYVRFLAIVCKVFEIWYTKTQNVIKNGRNSHTHCIIPQNSAPVAGYTSQTLNHGCIPSI